MTNATEKIRKTSSSKKVLTADAHRAENIIDMWEYGGVPNMEIAKEFDVSVEDVKNVIKYHKAGYTLPVKKVKK
jgi:transposase